MSKHSDNFYWPHDFGGYLSPEKAFEVDVNGTSLKDFKRWSKMTDVECDNCGRPIWRMCAELGMCFTCITGESDASDDYELEANL